MKQVIRFLFAIILCHTITAAHADSCSTIIPGASTSGYEGKYGGYDADGNCNARDVSESECKRLTGNLFLRWIPDGGANYTRCRFRVPSGSTTRPETRTDTYTAPRIQPEIIQIPVDDTNARYTLMLCNKSHKGTIYAAVAVLDVPDDKEETIYGWWTLKQGECAQSVTRNFGDFGSHTIFTHAEAKAEVNYIWPDPKNSTRRLCIADGKYQRKNTSGYNCAHGEILRPFAPFTIPKKGNGVTTVSWNFND